LGKEIFMEAVFKISGEELTPDFYETLKGILSIMKEPYLSIAIKDEDTFFSDKILQSRKELERR
jgi:hypothetical protein